MSETLYPYYEAELTFLRQLAPEFAKMYPRMAGHLKLLPDGGSTDPHVERLMEAFALVAGRIHHKLDDEFPELTDALLGVLYPHYLAPVPSMAIVQFDADPTRVPPEGFVIERGSPVQTPVVLNDVPVKFRTGYPVRLWPVEMTAARLSPPPFPTGLKPPPRTAAALRLEVTCQAGTRFDALGLDRLRLYLSGLDHSMATLYELIFNHALEVVFRPLDGEATDPIILPPARCLFPVGFERDEGLLPYPDQSFLGYRLLTEFFAFRHKFLFVDLGGWREAARAGFATKAEVIIFLNRTVSAVEQEIEATTFRLGCAPVINLFEKVAEPINLNHTKHQYRVVADVAHPQGMEIYSVNAVTSADPGSTVEYQPFYSYRHGQDREAQRAFWYASRRPALGVTDQGAPDRGTEVYLNLVDLGFDPRVPSEAALVVRTTCTNRDRPTQLLQESDRLPLELGPAAPLRRVRCLKSPTAPLRPPGQQGAYWRLLSHLNLNHLSITDPEEGRAALQEILRLYDFSDPDAGQARGAAVKQIVEGITAVSSRRVVRWLKPEAAEKKGPRPAGGFARGIELAVEVDEQKFVGTGTYLFACVLERFLGLYASINSFTQLVAKTKQGDGPFKTWPPRAGERSIL